MFEQLVRFVEANGMIISLVLAGVAMLAALTSALYGLRQWMRVSQEHEGAVARIEVQVAVLADRHRYSEWSPAVSASTAGLSSQAQAELSRRRKRLASALESLKQNGSADGSGD